MPYTHLRLYGVFTSLLFFSQRMRLREHVNLKPWFSTSLAGEPWFFSSKTYRIYIYIYIYLFIHSFIFVDSFIFLIYLFIYGGGGSIHQVPWRMLVATWPCTSQPRGRQCWACPLRAGADFTKSPPSASPAALDMPRDGSCGVEPTVATATAWNMMGATPGTI